MASKHFSKDDIQEEIEEILCEKLYYDFSKYFFNRCRKESFIGKDLDINKVNLKELCSKIMNSDLINVLSLLNESVGDWTSTRKKQKVQNTPDISELIKDLMSLILLNNISFKGNKIFEIKKVDENEVYEFKEKLPSSLVAQLLITYILGHLPKFVLKKNTVDVGGINQINLHELEVGLRTKDKQLDYLKDVVSQIFKIIFNYDAPPEYTTDHLISLINSKIGFDKNLANSFLVIDRNEKYHKFKSIKETNIKGRDFYLSTKKEYQEEIRKKLHKLCLFIIDRSDYTHSSIFDLKENENINSVITAVMSILEKLPNEGNSYDRE